ncbi:MAG TPA: indole-3-glycerol phosphate synthase TrpC [Chitinophagaceae bacterium]|nr:indole-3-glycerol phosphate synthase TrpC [Chitinophagaceae bacterium]
MNILEKIIAQKRVEVAARKAAIPIATLEGYPDFKKVSYSLKQALRDETKTGIIAEFKRASPSKGNINVTAQVEIVTADYTKGGASGVSVLTDENFFKGSLHDLAVAIKNVVPVLRKDFMIDTYQLVEAKAYGASVVLLIAACLSPIEVKKLAGDAKKLGLEVLLELHDETELEHICTEVDLVGINNRNLKTFSVDLEQSIRLAGKIGSHFLKIAESGINSAADVVFLKQQGFDGFLIGERFMKEKDPGVAFKTFVSELKLITL